MSSNKPYPWSYSRLKAFEQCPKQYYHEKVLKEFPFVETDAMLYGTELHEAAELYIRDAKPLPKHFEFIQSKLDKLRSIPGDKLCEYKMGVTKNLEPCEFDDDNVWFRGISDLNIINRDKGRAHVFDYKSGKNFKYADPGQLELMALATFAHFPKVQKVKAALLFVVVDKMVAEQYDRDQIPELWDKWLGKYRRFAGAYKSDVWNPLPSGLCRNHCPVLECPHNGRNK